MSLEDISAVEALLCGAAATRTEAADHGTFVVSEGMSVLVVLASKALCVVLACRYWALLWTLVLVCEHMCLEILDMPSACRNRAKTLVRVLRRMRVLAVS